MTVSENKGNWNMHWPYAGLILKWLKLSNIFSSDWKLHLRIIHQKFARSGQLSHKCPSAGLKKCLIENKITQNCDINQESKGDNILLYTSLNPLKKS